MKSKIAVSRACLHKDGNGTACSFCRRVAMASSRTVFVPNGGMKAAERAEYAAWETSTRQVELVRKGRMDDVCLDFICNAPRKVKPIG